MRWVSCCDDDGGEKIDDIIRVRRVVTMIITESDLWPGLIKTITRCQYMILYEYSDCFTSSQYLYIKYDIYLLTCSVLVLVGDCDGRNDVLVLVIMALFVIIMFESDMWAGLIINITLWFWWYCWCVQLL